MIPLTPPTPSLARDFLQMTLSTHLPTMPFSKYLCSSSSHLAFSIAFLAPKARTNFQVSVSARFHASTASLTRWKSGPASF